MKYHYNKYKQEHRKEHPRAFFKEHEKEPWFMEKYHPMTTYEIKMEHYELAKQKAEKFWSSVPLLGLKLSKKAQSGIGIGIGLNQDKDLECGYYQFDANQRTLYLGQIPVFVSRFMLKEAVTSVTKGLE